MPALFEPFGLEASVRIPGFRWTGVFRTWSPEDPYVCVHSEDLAVSHFVGR